MPDSIADAIADAHRYASTDEANGSPQSSVAEAIADAHRYSDSDQQSGGERFVHGLMDVPTGLAQITEHVAGTPLNWIRTGIRGALNLTGNTEAAQLFSDVSTKDFDNIVASREQAYQQERARAGSDGIDWWRMAGNIAQPLNYLMPGGAAETAAGRIGQSALQGAALGTAMPSYTPGNFWGDKAKGMLVGGATGAATAGALEGITKGVQAGVRAVRGSAVANTSQAANAIVDESLIANGADPKTVSIDLLRGMRAEVQDALDKGVQPSPQAIANRTLAESLPVPIQLTRGQATRDPLQYAHEFALKQVKEVGEPLAYNEVAQNRALIDNLNMMGAKDAPDPVSTGGMLADRIRSIDEALRGKIKEAYDAVRNSSGQPAAMDGPRAAEQIGSALDDAQLTAFLPKEIRSTLDDLSSGKLKLNVQTAQALDKAWTGMQSGKGNFGLSTSSDTAIQMAKERLLDAPIMDNAGQDSIAAYQQAKALAKGRFDLIKAIPAYKAVVNDVRDAEPDKFFGKFVMRATAREVSGLRNLVGKADPDADSMIGRTVMGVIKKDSINGPEETGAFSTAKFNNFLKDPEWNARMQALLPTDLLANLKNLGRVSELVQRQPIAAVPNRSGTAATGVNLIASTAKAGIGEKLSSMVSRQPIFSASLRSAAEQTAKNRMTREVGEALTPGVTSRALPALGPTGRLGMRLSSAALIPGVLAAEQEQ